ncbi:hypothetical protein MPSEU_000596600 [Mayamaea pseudoterrestris]|nr:hypothetical protein MPSEU_000596600 [Mayamaea pseudoterrestris]
MPFPINVTSAMSTSHIEAIEKLVQDIIHANQDRPALLNLRSKEEFQQKLLKYQNIIKEVVNKVTNIQEADLSSSIALDALFSFANGEVGKQFYGMLAELTKSTVFACQALDLELIQVTKGGKDLMMLLRKVIVLHGLSQQNNLNFKEYACILHKWVTELQGEFVFDNIGSLIPYATVKEETMETGKKESCHITSYKNLMAFLVIIGAVLVLPKSELSRNGRKDPHSCISSYFEAFLDPSSKREMQAMRVAFQSMAQIIFGHYQSTHVSADLNIQKMMQQKLGLKNFLNQNKKNKSTFAAMSALVMYQFLSDSAGYHTVHFGQGFYNGAPFAGKLQTLGWTPIEINSCRWFVKHLLYRFFKLENDATAKAEMHPLDFSLKLGMGILVHSIHKSDSTATLAGQKQATAGVVQQDQVNPLLSICEGSQGSQAGSASTSSSVNVENAKKRKISDLKESEESNSVGKLDVSGSSTSILPSAIVPLKPLLLGIWQEMETLALRFLGNNKYFFAKDQLFDALDKFSDGVLELDWVLHCFLYMEKQVQGLEGNGAYGMATSSILRALELSENKK